MPDHDLAHGAEDWRPLLEQLAADAEPDTVGIRASLVALAAALQG